MPLYYATIGSLAILILLIENYDLFLNRSDVERFPVWSKYRRFLLAVLLYYVTDVLWGFIESRKLATMLFIDTSFYFVAMAGGILFWTQFAVSYLDEKNTYGKFLVYTGRIFFGVVVGLVFLNIYTPILFSVDENCVYVANPFRYVLLVTQIVLLILNAIHAFLTIARKKEASKDRYLAIASFALIMATFLTIQLWHPYLPLYSVAYLLGTALLHSFVVNIEKDEYKTELEEAVAREKQQYQELLDARVLAYKDALTGVKTKLAYLEFEAQKDNDIQNGRKPEFAIAVFDVNGLKVVNDTRGHEAGDQFIIDACMMICNHFKHSPVFRIGGDEFVVLMEGDDYRNRQELIIRFNRMMDEPERPDPIIIAMGVTDFDAEKDGTFHDVFIRADQLMYERKRALKSKA